MLARLRVQNAGARTTSFDWIFQQRGKMLGSIETADNAFCSKASIRGSMFVPISGQGWELHIVRETEQRRASDGKRRTVGQYQVYHDGEPQTGADLKGTTAESKGPGANEPADNGKRIEPGRYPLWTQEPGRYATWGYQDSESTGASPKPGFELKDTGERYEILLHP